MCVLGWGTERSGVRGNCGLGVLHEGRIKKERYSKFGKRNYKLILKRIIE